MNTIGVLLLAAATAGAGFGKPNVGGKRLLRPHVVRDGPAPPGGPIMPGMAGGGPGGMGGPEAQPGRRFPNVRSQVFFLDPDNMRIGWQTGAPQGERVFVTHEQAVPFRYNFMQGYIYRLKLTDIANHPGVALYPTIEVAPSTPATDAYLTHNPIPVQFTAEDFEQVIDGGNFVTKVIYLPDPRFQELAIAGVETLVSTRLEPGVDPILEADKRGTILMIVRLGQIDLEMPSTSSAPSSVVMPGSTTSTTIVNPGMPAETTVMPPNTLPPGVVEPIAPAPPANVPLDPIPPTPADPAPVPADPAPVNPEPAPVPVDPATVPPVPIPNP